MQETIFTNKLNAIGIEPTLENQEKLRTFEMTIAETFYAGAQLSTNELKIYRNIFNVGLKEFAARYLFTEEWENINPLRENPWAAGIIYQLGWNKTEEIKAAKQREQLLMQFNTDVSPYLPRMKFERYEQLVNQMQEVRRLYKLYSGEGTSRGYYGKVNTDEDILTFRPTAEALRLPETTLNQIQAFGQAINLAFGSIPNLPNGFLTEAEYELARITPPLFRVDFTIAGNGIPKAMEVQVDDSAIGLMAVETAIYTGRDPAEISAPAFIRNIRERFGLDTADIIWLYDFKDKKAVPSLARFVDQVWVASRGEITIDLISSSKIAEINAIPGSLLWNYSYADPMKITQLINKFSLQEIAPSPLSIYSSKKLFSLLCNPQLKDFWINNLGIDAYAQILTFIPETQMIQAGANINKIVRSKKWVLKVGAQIPELIDGGKGVFGPWNDYIGLEFLLKKYAVDQLQLQMQEYIKPKAFGVLVPNVSETGRPLLGLRNYSGPSRICATFINQKMTALEATISKTEPAKGYQDCAYTAVLPK